MNRGSPHAGRPDRPAEGRSATFAEKQPSSSPLPPGPTVPHEEARLIRRQWQTFASVATGVAVLTAPFFFLLLYRGAGWSVAASAIVAALAVFAFRGFLDVVSRRFIPMPGLFEENRNARATDLSARRRAWFWRFWFRLVVWIALLWLAVALVTYVVDAIRGDASITDALTAPLDALRDQFNASRFGTLAGLALTVAAVFLVNVVIFLGPLLIAGMRQIKYFEPGDANWGVTLDQVRGQDRPKDEVRKIVSLWQSGQQFEQAGGKRERGVIFYGAPGTGKTMLAKAMATGFNCPFVLIPGSGLRQSFIGVDAILISWVTWRARRLARKWGGQCIVFIDELDAIGGRRGVLTESTIVPREFAYHGRMGAITSSGDLVKETNGWREHLFHHRAPEPRTLYPNSIQRVADRVRAFAVPGMMDGAGGAGLQGLLIAMDGFATPSGLRRWTTNRINTLLDAMYVIPPQVGNVSLRLPPTRPPRDQELFFVGACNVPIESLDPALTRPGRMGRYVWFQTPNRRARADIIDLYLGKIAHEVELDSDAKRGELARITMGHSPAMIQQVCSLALTYAHNDGRQECAWRDITEAVTVVENGLESGFQFVPDEERAIAIHEAGHAVTGHVFLQESHRSSRLTITPRGNSAGHHMMYEIDDRFALWQHEKFGDLVWTLGAMAAERVFYGENGEGVGGDIGAATRAAAWMVGTWGMAPHSPDLRATFATADQAEVAERKLMRRYERLGMKIVNRSAQGSVVAGDPVASVLADPTKLAMVAQFLGQAFMTAYWFIQHNREAVSRVADVLVERRALFGDDVVELLDRQNLTIPDVDPLDEDAWPRI